MKKTIAFLIGTWILFAAACIKKNQLTDTASLTMFNGIIGIDTVVTNLNGTTPIKWYLNAGKVLYGSYYHLPDYYASLNHFEVSAGKNLIGLYKYPDTTNHSNPIFLLDIELPAFSIHSLFLTGTREHPDTLFTRDILPFHATADSAMGLRFVNLCPGDQSISINLQGEANGTQLQELAYKKITGFKNYEVTRSKEEYVFEFRDASSGELISTYTIDLRDQQSGPGWRNHMRNQNFTLAIFGEPGNTGVHHPAVQLIRNN